MSEPQAPLYNRFYGLARSLAIYHGRPGRGVRLRRFYARFIRPGSLCFDIGAHVGDRSRCWSRLGARVVALEPQPDFVRFLRLLFRHDPRVLVVAHAVGAASGCLTLHVSPRTPTVTSGSLRFLAEAARVPGFAWVDWSQQIKVPLTTLDWLIEAHGPPAFVKIDVEGMEHEVLAGLSVPLPALSFEFIPASPYAALASVARLEDLGRYEYNLALGEGFELVYDRWLNAAELRAWLATRDRAGPSGDIYAVRLDEDGGLGR
ncbi:MAG: FkbM family methyltransferase [Rhodopila sp.]